MSFVDDVCQILCVSFFPFGIEGRMWDVIVLIPDYCLSIFYTSSLWRARYPLFLASFQPRTFRYLVFLVARQFTISLLELVVYKPLVCTILAKICLN